MPEPCERLVEVMPLIDHSPKIESRPGVCILLIATHVEEWIG